MYFSRRDACLLGLEGAVLLGALGHPRLQSVRLGELYSFTLDVAMQQSLLPFWDAGALHGIATRLQQRGRLSRCSLLPWEGVIELALPGRQAALADGDRALYDSSEAHTLGLEGAVLLVALRQLRERTVAPVLQLDEEQREALLPFWGLAHCAKLARDLCQRGVLLETHQRGDRLALQLPPTAATDRATDATPKSPRGIRRRTSSREAPHTAHDPLDADLLRMLKQQGITRTFARAQLGEFLYRRREKGQHPEFLASAFMGWTRRAWEYQQQNQAERISLSMHWQPDPRSRDILLRERIPANFVQHRVEEFLLNATGRQAPAGLWEQRFLSYVRKQWRSHGAQKQRRGFAERIRDTSWA